jgi:hypothetical protein
MNYKLKTLGLALVAVLAMSAMAAPMASAEGELFHSTVEPTTLDVSAIGGQDFEVITGIFECKQVVFDATLAKKTVSEFKAIPTYTECKIGGKEPARVTQTSCYYVFTSSIPAGKTVAPTHIECSTAGDSIDLEIETAGKWRPCIDIPAQKPGGGATYAKNGNHLDITSKVTGIKYTLTGLCGGGETKEGGAFQGNVTVKGTDANKNEATLEWK